jgi:hypothetical protein
MTLAPPAPQAPATGLEPLVLPPALQLTPEQFPLVCEANPEAVLELAADGQLITMTPTGGETGTRCPAAVRQLHRLFLAPVAPKPSAARWRSTRPTAPSWAGCCSRSSEPWRSGLANLPPWD